MASDKNFIDSILDDAEKDKLQAFADDQVMQRAVKKLLLIGIYYNGTLKEGEQPNPTRNFAITLAMTAEKSNEQLGADLRGTNEGIIRLEQGFAAVDLYKTLEKPSVDKLNAAR